MRTYFRGDSRPDLFEEGFKIKDEKSKVQKHVYSFSSFNAISMSTVLEAAAAFPITNLDKESYIYIIRNSPSLVYDLYSKSLQELECNNEELIRLSWATEQVSEIEIPGERIIGRTKIERFFKTVSEEVTPYDISSLKYFHIKELKVNPFIGEKTLTIPEKLLFKRIHAHIVNEDKITSKLPKLSEISSLQSTSRHYRLEKEKLDKKNILHDELTYSMLFAACKAKVFQKEKNCQQEMRLFLQDIFVKYSRQLPRSKLMNFICNPKISGDSMEAFYKANVKEVTDIARLDVVSLEKLFFSIHLLYQENNSRLNDPSNSLRLKKIINDYMEIDVNHSPQL